VIFVALVLREYRLARFIAALAIAADLAIVLHGQLPGDLSPFASWSPLASWVLLDLAPVLALATFHRDSPPVRRRPWLLALPVCYLLVAVPLLAAELTGHSSWVPDTPGLYCVLVALACLAHAICLARGPRGRSPPRLTAHARGLRCLAAGQARTITARTITGGYARRCRPAARPRSARRR
jgi:hypothetical protein